MSVPAGWFPDPAGAPPDSHRETYRWWDGEAWTRWLTNNPGAAPPRAEPEDEATPPVEPASSVDSVRAPLAATLIIGVVIAALVGVGTTVALTGDRIRTGPAAAPPSPTPVPAVSYRPATRTVSVDELRMVMPAAPYDCLDAPAALFPFASAVSCDVLVHRDYDEKQDWYATAGVGLLPESLVVSGNLKKTGESLFMSLRKRFFPGHDTKVAKFVATPTDLSTPGKSIVISGEIQYKIKGLPSTYDRMFVALVELRSGRSAAFYSVRPNDLPQPALTALDASLDTLSAR